MIRYLEVFSSGKLQGVNGDRVFTSEHFCAVIDGATDKNNTVPGSAVADVIHDSFSMLAPDIEPEAIVDAVTASVRTLQGHLSPPERGSATLLCYSSVHGKIVRVGDSHFMIDDQKNLGTKAIDNLLAEARSVYLSICDGAEASGDPGRKAIMPFLALQYKLQNNNTSPYGYGVIDGQPVPHDFIEVFSVPAGAEVVFCSDGYPQPGPTLASAEEELFALLAQDPKCIGPLKGTKAPVTPGAPFDDRTYVRFQTLTASDT